MKRVKLTRLTDEELLDLRLKDLPVRIQGTELEDRVARLYQELRDRNVRLKPHVWLAEEWFSPDGVPGIAIPFYLAHPRLMQLEKKMMLEVEGGTDRECMRILRHEAGHAIDSAYRLHHKRRWQHLFGSFTKRYPESYRPRPNSRNFVLHLNAWYAQAHPAEDFAETFAVWLTPGSRWRKFYQGWPVLEKLQFVDQIMQEIAGTPPVNRLQIKVDPLSSLKRTLREHYRRKREYYDFEWPAFYDRDLKRIFSDAPRYSRRMPASRFLRGIRSELRDLVAEVTGVHRYTIDHLLRELIARSRELKLRLAENERETKRKTLVLLTMHTMNLIHVGYHRFAL